MVVESLSRLERDWDDTYAMARTGTPMTQNMDHTQIHFPSKTVTVMMVEMDKCPYYDALSPLLGAASARLGSSSLEQQDATIG